MGTVLGIDASNIRAGGGLTHLVELLRAANPSQAGIERIIVWGGRATLNCLPDRADITKQHCEALDGGLPRRLLWQQLQLPKQLLAAGCDILFAPGGTLPFRPPVPTVTMSQNLLPFEPHEAARFGRLSLMRLKMALLRYSQGRSFAKADGLIFLTEYARKTVLAAIGHRNLSVAVVPHGIDGRFFVPPRPVLPADAFSLAKPFRLLYVSIIDAYKHQWLVAEAVARLRAAGVPVVIDFVGPGRARFEQRLHRTITRLDPAGEFLRYCGAIPYDALHTVYREADAFVYASSCENLPNIMLEAMAAGLPIASSKRGPMPEVLGTGGVFFDPESPADIAEAIDQLFKNPQLREQHAYAAFAAAQRYSWERCAADSFAFIGRIAHKA